jgi:radical SAM-linked protein
MRVRLQYSKRGKVRWTSHRDLARMFERAFRRIQLPLAYSGGFAPRPRVSFGLALPTGAESAAEYLDIELVHSGIDLEMLPVLLSEELPAGVTVAAAAAIDDRAPSLQEAVTSCTWRMEIMGATHDALREKVAVATAARSLVVTRNRKGRKVTDDVRPGILALAVLDGTEVECELVTQPRAVRPAELVEALDPELEGSRVRRINQWIERDGARGTPLDATNAPHAMPESVAGGGARAR